MLKIVFRNNLILVSLAFINIYSFVQVCPSLYRVEDAASSKAHELLLAAAQSNKPAERQRMIQEAVEIAKSIAGSRILEVKD